MPEGPSSVLEKGTFTKNQAPVVFPVWPGYGIRGDFITSLRQQGMQEK
jgi:hypothetical protein